MAGSLLSYTDDTTKTAMADIDVGCSFTAPYAWSGTVTPTKPGYTYTPTNKTYTPLFTDQMAQIYMASENLSSSLRVKRAMTRQRC